ncbi:CgeB family protein [Sorangium sp. So ce128]|uniref:CgeB family protein n=1 Tax=Sorangium sp. So ce128 TaxID=3133281 RepID=UPI003F63C391
MKPISFVFLGLSITSSWGNGHATTYRGLLRRLAQRGHSVLFLERDLSFYAENRDLPSPPYGRTELYRGLDDLRARFGGAVRDADLVVVGSYVPDGAEVGAWVTETARGKTAFYDIDTPVTLKQIERGGAAYLSPALIPRYDLYLSFTGGPTLERLERRHGAKRARPLYCAVDPDEYFPERAPPRWDLGYLGTYSADRQPTLDRLLVAPARRWGRGRFVVAGPQYPADIGWPTNVERTDHVPPGAHRGFYGAQRFTLNVTRRDMIEAGYSPSVRLFEAAACGVPVISDDWPGLDELFEPGKEILVARSPEEVLHLIRELPERERIAIGQRARERVLARHTAAHRAEALERYTRELLDEQGAPERRSARETGDDDVDVGSRPGEEVRET